MVARNYIPGRGDIVWADFDPVRGHEEQGRRPAFAVSSLEYNSRSGLALLCPITSKPKGYPFEVEINLAKIKGVILADQVRSVDWSKRRIKLIAKADYSVLEKVRERLALLIN
ncbi:endoribonuclease MazF [Candidatus Parcubacteria bacterium]|nr:endoribonuclease MazF [Candidatus Parcubacteria bacterium]